MTLFFAVFFDFLLAFTEDLHIYGIYNQMSNSPREHVLKLMLIDLAHLLMQG